MHSNTGDATLPKPQQVHTTLCSIGIPRSSSLRRTCCPKFGRHRAKLCQLRATFGRFRADVVESGQCRDHWGRIRAEVDRPRANLWSFLGEFWSKLTNFETGRNLAETMDPIWSLPSQSWSKSVEYAPNSGTLGLNSTKLDRCRPSFRPSSTRNRQNSGDVDRSCPDLVQRSVHSATLHTIMGLADAPPNAQIEDTLSRWPTSPNIGRILSSKIPTSPKIVGIRPGVRLVRPEVVEIAPEWPSSPKTDRNRARIHQPRSSLRRNRARIGQTCRTSAEIPSEPGNIAQINRCRSKCPGPTKMTNENVFRRRLEVRWRTSDPMMPWAGPRPGPKREDPRGIARSEGEWGGESPTMGAELVGRRSSGGRRP